MDYDGTGDGPAASSPGSGHSIFRSRLIDSIPDGYRARPAESCVDRPITKAAGSTYRGDIDGLRALAVSLVVLFHAAPGYLPGGFVGVDVFFVISGYLITGIILSKAEQNRFSYLEFLGRRVRRIGPALVTVLLATLAMGFFIASYPDFRAVGIQVSAASAFSANILFWLQSGYFDGVAESKPLLHLWSLGVEEQFYLIWPMLILLAVMPRLRKWPIVLSVTLLSFATNVALINKFPDATFYLLPGRLWELGLGGALTWYRARRLVAIGHTRANLEAWVGLGLIVISAVLLDQYVAFPGWWAVLPTMGTILVIDAGPGAWANSRLLASRPFRGIGLISYPIYLWHWPLLVFAGMSPYSGPLPNLTAVILALLLAYLTYRHIEVPIRFGRFTARRYSPLLVTSIVGAIVMTAGLGQLAPVWQRQGRNLPYWAVEDYRANSVAAYREGRCFLRVTQTAAEFVPECNGTERSSSSPLVMLWGDSYAADLYPGLLAQQQREDRNFRLAQFTASSCPPVFGISVDFQPNCKGVLDRIEGIIGQVRPDTVIMAANWFYYANAHPSDNRVIMGHLAETVQRLHAMGVAHVVVIGPMPTWDLPLPEALLREIGPGAAAPEYMSKPLRSKAFDTDATIRSAAIADGSRYVSTIEVLCDGGRGCLATVATSHGAEPTAWDDGHLTTPGSIEFINRIWDRSIAPGLSRVSFQPTIAAPGG